MTVKTMSGKKAIKFVKEMLKRGDVSRLVVRSEDGKTCYLNIPVGVALVSGLFAPFVSGLYFTLAFVKKCKIEFVTSEDLK